jgi:hypothetical protein
VLETRPFQLYPSFSAAKGCQGTANNTHSTFDHHRRLNYGSHLISFSDDDPVSCDLDVTKETGGAVELGIYYISKR